MLRLGIFYIVFQSGDNLLFKNCKIMSNARAASPNDMATPNVGIQRQLVSCNDTLNLPLWVGVCARRKT